MAKRDEERPRRLNALRNRSKLLDRHRRDSLALQRGGYQTHGLVAHRSDRNEQGDIDGVVNEQGRNFRGRVTDESPWCRNRTHEG